MNLKAYSFSCLPLLSTFCARSQKECHFAKNWEVWNKQASCTNSTYQQFRFPFSDAWMETWLKMSLSCRFLCKPGWKNVHHQISSLFLWVFHRFVFYAFWSISSSWSLYLWLNLRWSKQGGGSFCSETCTNTPKHHLFRVPFQPKPWRPFRLYSIKHYSNRNIKISSNRFHHLTIRQYKSSLSDLSLTFSPF